MKNIVRIFLKYRIYFPYSLFRNLYYNFYRINRAWREAYFFISRHSVLDVHKTAKISLQQSVVFGWCNMAYSKIETALYMGEQSNLYFIGKSKKPMLIGYGSYIQVGRNAVLEIGDSFINREVKIICNERITIGIGCIIAMGTVIRDNDGGNHKIKSPNYKNSAPVKISDHVWIGENVMILKGVTIGEGAVIAAGSLVTKDIPPHCLAMGVPARIVRENVEWEV